MTLSATKGSESTTSLHQNKSQNFCKVCSESKEMNSISDWHLLHICYSFTKVSKVFLTSSTT